MRKERLLSKVANKYLSEHEAALVPKGLEIIGNIAVIRLPKVLEKKRFWIAKNLLKETPCINSVFKQTSPVLGKHRIRQLEWLAGKKDTTTLHMEYGCQFKVDLDKVYFSQRLSYERMRIAKLVQEKQVSSYIPEIIVNAFAGVGCFSIAIAKHTKAKKIYSIDINPHAVQLMNENIALNKVVGRVISIHGDAKSVIERKLIHVADRVLMPLPEKAYEYLDSAISALKPSGGTIHYYDFTHAKKGEDPRSIVVEKVFTRLQKLGVSFDIPFSRIIRTVGPRWFQIVLDVHVTI